MLVLTKSFYFNIQLKNTKDRIECRLTEFSPISRSILVYGFKKEYLRVDTALIIKLRCHV